MLGITQGLTEFLPISSSGHLILVPWLFNWEQNGLEFDAALHLGTLIAVFVYFWRDIANMLVKLKYEPEAQPQTVSGAATPSTNATPVAATPIAAASSSVTTPPAANVVAATPSAAAPAANLGGAAPTKFVYLAETATDLAGERERVRDELRQRGYGVLP